MSDTLFDLTQYQSPAHISYSADWKDATGTDPAWEQPDRELDLGTNPQVPVDDALNQWRTEAENTLTLQSGQTVEVTFVPCLVGDRRMHEFSFTGPVSPTGFKSHFVLAVEAEQFPHPRDYAQAYAEEMFARFEAQPQHSGKKLKPIDFAARAPQEVLSADDDSLVEPTMPSDKTDALNNTPVEVVDELSPSEESDRQRLELKVERFFYQGGAALRELRDKRLYRSTHRTFEQYCQDRFSFSRISAYNKITTAEVMDNLLSNALQDGEKANAQKPLPNSERQCKELAKLPKEQQPQAWIEAVARTPGKRIPAASTVKAVVLEMKGIAEPLNHKHPSPSEFAPGDVVEIKALKLEPLHPFNGMWAIIDHVGSFSYTVRLSIARDTQQCKPEEVTLIEDEYTADIKAVAQRIAALIQFELEPVEYAILELLQRSRCFTPKQMALLAFLEQEYSIS